MADFLDAVEWNWPRSWRDPMLRRSATWSMHNDPHMSVFNYLAMLDRQERRARPWKRPLDG